MLGKSQPISKRHFLASKHALAKSQAFPHADTISPPTSPRLNKNEVLEGEITFVGRGNPSPSKFYIVPQAFSVPEFAKNYLARDIARPQVIISVTGGTQHFKMLPSNLEKIFNRGILKAAEHSRAIIVTGGMSSGVMEFVGNALCAMDMKVTCIGIATFSKVSRHDILERGGKVSYSTEKKNDNHSASLQQDHTHFVLIKSDVDEWGQELQFRSDLEHYFAQHSIPTVLVALNGGLTTISTLVEAARKQIPIIIVEQSGRACDGIAAFLKHREDNKRYKIDLWDKLFKSKEDLAQKDECTRLMNELCAYRERISIFTPSLNAAEDMDKVILRSIMQVKVSLNEPEIREYILKNHAREVSSSFYGKMELGVQWGRADLIEELLRQEDTDTTPQEKADAINKSLQQALLLDKPDIYELLIKKGADKDSINIVDLFDQESEHIDRLMPYAGVVAKSGRERSSSNFGSGTAQNIPTLLLNSQYERIPDNSPDPYVDIAKYERLPENAPESYVDHAKQVLRAVNRIYEQLLDDKQTTFTDALVWAIMVNRPELARAIWRNMEYPVHSALLACHLYYVLGELWFKGDELYNECRKWFEAEAIAVLSEASYEQAIPILKWKWNDLQNHDALQLAEMAHCQDFTAHPYVQRYLDQKQYYDRNGHIPPGTSMWRILLLAICPFLIPFTTSTYEPDENSPNPRFYHFYNLTVVKIVTSTLSYVLYLVLLTVNVMQCAPGRYALDWYEFLLWIWIFASLIDEVVQYIAFKENYFNALSNQMDLIANIGLLGYIALRIFAWLYHDDGFVEAYCNVLIVTIIICYVRLMTVFAVSKSLGPLFFVIVRLFKDVLLWLFIFLVFMGGFQVAIFALTRLVWSQN